MGYRKGPVVPKKKEINNQLNLFSELESKTRNKDLAIKRLLKSKERKTNKIFLAENKLQQNKKLQIAFKKKYSAYLSEVNNKLSTTNYSKILKRERSYFENRFLKKIMTFNYFKNPKNKEIYNNMLRDNKLIIQGLTKIISAEKKNLNSTNIFYVKFIGSLKERLIKSNENLINVVKMSNYLNIADGLRRSYKMSGDKNAAEGVTSFVNSYKIELPQLVEKLRNQYPKDIAFVQTMRGSFKKLKFSIKS